MRLYVLTKSMSDGKAKHRNSFHPALQFLPAVALFTSQLSLGLHAISIQTAHQDEWRVEGAELQQLKGSRAELPSLPQGETLQTATFRVSFNTFLVLETGQVRKMLQHPHIPMNNKLVLDKMTKSERKYRSDSRQHSHFCLLGVKLLKVSSFLGIHLDSLTGSGKRSAVDQVQSMLSLLLCKYLRH